MRDHNRRTTGKVLCLLSTKAFCKADLGYTEHGTSHYHLYCTESPVQIREVFRMLYILPVVQN
jgi:hypothetical protein